MYNSVVKLLKNIMVFLMVAAAFFYLAERILISAPQNDEWFMVFIGGIWALLFVIVIIKSKVIIKKGMIKAIIRALKIVIKGDV